MGKRGWRVEDLFSFSLHQLEAKTCCSLNFKVSLNLSFCPLSWQDIYLEKSVSTIASDSICAEITMENIGSLLMNTLAIGKGKE